MKHAAAILPALIAALLAAALPSRACEEVNCAVCGAVYPQGQSCPNAGAVCSICGASTHNATGTCPNAYRRCTYCGESDHGFHLCLAGLWNDAPCPVCGEKDCLYDITREKGEDGITRITGWRCRFDEDTCGICGASTHTAGHRCATFRTCAACGTEYMHASACPNAGRTCAVCGKSTHNALHECPDAVFAVCTTCGAHTHEGDACPNAAAACTVCGGSLHAKSWKCPNEFRVCALDCEVMTHSRAPECPLAPQWKCGKCGMYSRHGSACTNGCETLHQCTLSTGHRDAGDNRKWANRGTSYTAKHSSTYALAGHSFGFCQTCGRELTSQGTCPKGTRTCSTCGTKYCGSSCPNASTGSPCALCGATVPHGGTCPNAAGVPCTVCGATVPHGGTCPNLQSCAVCGRRYHGSVCPLAAGTACAVCGAAVPHGSDTCPNAADHHPRIASVNGTPPVSGGAVAAALPLDVLARHGLGGTVYLYCWSAGRTGWTCPRLARAGLKKAPSPVAMYLFGRRLYPTLSTVKGDFAWDEGEEFVLLISTRATPEGALEEMQECCAAAGCPRHVRVRCRAALRPVR